jgi:hypothetical protein
VGLVDSSYVEIQFCITQINVDACCVAAAESHFQSELMRRIGVKSADALDCATKAELRLAPRSLTREQVECPFVLMGTGPSRAGIAPPLAWGHNNRLNPDFFGEAIRGC